MRTFLEWLKEMVGTSAVYDGTKSPDFNWWGAPESMIKPKKKKKKNGQKKQ